MQLIIQHSLSIAFQKMKQRLENGVENVILVFIEKKNQTNTNYSFREI